MEDLEIKTVDTILDKGVRISIPTPLFLRVFGKKTIAVTVRRPMFGNMLRISAMYVKMCFTDEMENEEDWRSWINVFVAKAKPTSRIVAVGILRGQFIGWLLHRPLAHYLRWHMDSKQIAELAAILVSLSGVQDFMTTITFLRGMKITAPANVSQ